MRGLQQKNDLLKADIGRQQKRMTGMVETTRLEKAQKPLAETSRQLEEMSKTNSALGARAQTDLEATKTLAKSLEEKYSGEMQKAQAAQKQLAQLKTQTAGGTPSMQAANEDRKKQIAEA